MHIQAFQYQQQNTDLRCSSPPSVMYNQTSRTFHGKMQDYNPPRILSIDMMRLRDPKFSSQFPIGFDVANRNVMSRDFKTRNPLRVSPGKNSSAIPSPHKVAADGETNLSRQSQRAVIGVLQQIVQTPQNKDQDDTKNIAASEGSMDQKKSACANRSFKNSSVCADELEASSPNDLPFLKGKKPILSNRPKGIN